MQASEMESMVLVQKRSSIPQTRESVVLAVMIALTVASRMLFAFSPGFKPVSAMVIICGMAFGRESGFLCGSLSAVVSSFHI